MIQTQTLRRLAIVTLVVVNLLLAFSPAGVAASNQTLDEKAPYYNQTGEVSTDGWLQGVDTSLGGVLTLVSRTGTYVIGGGGGGVSGALLTGVVVMGMSVGVVARTPVGGVAGATLAVAGTFAATGIGIAPTWMTAVVMFGVGLVISAVGKRVIG